MSHLRNWPSLVEAQMAFGLWLLAHSVAQSVGSMGALGIYECVYFTASRFLINATNTIQIQ